MRKRLLFLTIAYGILASATNIQLTSPDQRLHINITTDAGLSWQVSYDSIVAITPSPIRLTIQEEGQQDALCIGDNDTDWYIGRIETIDQLRPQDVYVKRQSTRDHFRRVLLTSPGRGAIEFRAYNDGAAYRFIPEANHYNVLNEVVTFSFAGDYPALLPYENDRRGGHPMCFSFESYYDRQSLSTMFADSLCITPLCVTHPEGLRILLAETGVRAYPGMFARKGTNNSLQAVFPCVPTQFEVGGFTDLNLVPTRRTNYIAMRHTANQPLPWRVVACFKEDAQILNSDLMQNLAQADLPCKAQAHSTRKKAQSATPSYRSAAGQSVWDWWNNWELTNVPFTPGINDSTYRYYARFAAQHHIPYMIVDDGWSDHGDLMQQVGELHIPELVRYADSLGVGVILWSSYRAMLKNTRETFRYFADMGVRGFKVDFFDRNDQVITDDVWQLAALADEYHLLLDLHGYMPTGIQAVHPNVMSFEGVKGLENFKWELMVGDRTEHDHPLNTVLAPFLRGFIGPYDYTPGSMRNATYQQYAQGGLQTIGTRANQLAMYVVQEAPLQMLADSPSKYLCNKRETNFITSVPTLFAETRILQAEMGEYIVTARRQGKKWYIGAMSRTERTITLPLSFIGKGKHHMLLAQDDELANTDATDIRFTESTVSQHTTLTIHLAEAGGFAAIIE